MKQSGERHQEGKGAAVGSGSRKKRKNNSRVDAEKKTQGEGELQSTVKRKRRGGTTEHGGKR